MIKHTIPPTSQQPKNNNKINRSNYHPNNSRQHNQHHQQGPPPPTVVGVPPPHQPQFYNPHQHYQQYPPQIYQGFQPQGVPHQPQYIHQNYHPHHQGYIPQPQVVSQPPGTPVITQNTGFHPQGPPSPVPPHLQQGTNPQNQLGNSPQSPQQSRSHPQPQSPQQQQVLPHQQSPQSANIIVGGSQPPVVVVQPQPQQQPQSNRKQLANKPSVNSNNIPPRTHSAPPTSSDIQEHNGIQTKFLPDKTGGSHQFVPPGQQPPQQQGYNKPPGIPNPTNHPNESPPPYNPGGPYIHHQQFYTPHHQPYGHYSHDPFAQPVYFTQVNGHNTNIHQQMNPTPYIKETKTSSKLAIINPETMEQVNQSPPKSTPQQPPTSVPSFSLGNESLRKHNKDKVDQKPATTTDDKKPLEQSKQDNQEPDTSITKEADSEGTSKQEHKDQLPVKNNDTPINDITQKEEQSTIKVEQPTTPKMETIKEDESSTDSQISKETSDLPTTTTTTTDDVTEDIKKLSITDTSSANNSEEINVQDTTSTTESSQESSSKTSESNSTIVQSTPALRNTSDKITYSRDFMISLQPRSNEEPRNIKDLKAQMENSGQGQGNNLNRSGNKIGQRNMMNMSGNSFQQQGMKMYPNQMQMKNYPQNKNYQNQNFAKNYQQQIQQIGFQQPMQLQQQPIQQVGYGITTFQQAPVQPPIASQVNENRWIPTDSTKLTDNEKTLRKAKAILNRITPDKFDNLTQQLLELGVIQDEEIHKGTIQMIFEKALNESKFCTMYSDLCKKLFEYEKNKKAQEKNTYFENNKEDAIAYMGMTKPQQDQFEELKKLKPLFRKLLLLTCQQEYEKAHKEFEKQEHPPPPDSSTPEEKADWEEKQFIKRKLEFGLIKFIGELFNKDMLSEKILHGIFVNLLGELNKPVEIKLECFCRLLTITGKTLSSNEKAANYLSKYCQRMKELTVQSTLSQRLKFLIQNVLDLKAANWNPKNDEAPKPLKEFESNREDDRKSNTGVKTVKNNFITNTIFSNKFTSPNISNKNISGPTNNNNPNTKMGVNTTPMQPSVIMKKPPGLSGMNSFNNNNNSFNNKATNTSPNGPPSPTNQNPKRNNEQWEKVKRTVEECISEYLEIQDKDEFIACIEDYLGKQLFLYPHVISTMFVSSINLSDSLFTLMMELINEDKLFSLDDFKEGFTLFISTLPDLYEDRPGSYKILGSIFYQCYQAKMLSLALMSSLLSKQVEATTNFVPQILFEFILQFKNPKDAATNFNAEKININDFFSKKGKSSIIEFSTNYNDSLGLFFENLKDF